MNEVRKNEGVEKAVCIDMYRLVKSICSERRGTYGSNEITRCIEAVKAKIPLGYRNVQLIGPAPNIFTMAVTAALYPIVSRLEYGEFHGPRHVVFLEEECPELAL